MARLLILNADKIPDAKVDIKESENKSNDKSNSGLRIFTPKSLMKNCPDLLTAASKYGWPTLKELKGAIIIVLTGDQPEVAERKVIYSTTNPSERMCFVDRSFLSNFIYDSMAF